MRTFLFLVLFLALQSFGADSPLAADPAQPPLQLVPGSGVQSGAGQGMVQPQSPGAGQGSIPDAEQEQLRDIHPPLLLPEEMNYILPAAGLLLFLLASAALFWFFRRRTRKPVLPLAHETALADLLRLRPLMSPEQALRYAEELSDILRRYIEKRFRIRASRKTTREFFATLTENPSQTALLVEDHSDSLRSCLDQCDMAKFARCSPDLQSMKKMETAVEVFIEATREQIKGEG